MKQLILFLSILFLATACSNDDSDKSNIAYTVIAQNNLSGKEGQTKSNIVIKDAETWNKLLTETDIKNFVSIFTETEIDFTKYQIIVMYDEMHPYNGYFVDIKSITESNSTITVYLDYRNAGGIATVLTRPFKIAKIAKSNKKVVFK